MTMVDESQEFSELIGRLNAGDPTAVDDLFARCYGRLVKLAWHMLGSYPDLRGGHDGESIVHRVWGDLVAALRSVQIESTKDFLRLSATKMRFELIDLARRERRRADRLPLNLGAGGNDDSSFALEPAVGSSMDAGKLELWMRFHEAVGNLPGDVREAFELQFYQGFARPRSPGCST